MQGGRVFPSTKYFTAFRPAEMTKRKKKNGKGGKTKQKTKQKTTKTHTQQNPMTTYGVYLGDVNLEKLGVEGLKVELGVLLELVDEGYVSREGDVVFHVRLRMSAQKRRGKTAG